MLKHFSWTDLNNPFTPIGRFEEISFEFQKGFHQRSFSLNVAEM
jgi:hypothetical protein